MGEDKRRTEQTLDEDLSRDRSVDGKDVNGDVSRDRPVGRMTVPEAAEMMGVTQSAIRKRVHRGTIPWDKDHEGRIYVYVDPSEMSPETRGGQGTGHVRGTVSGRGTGSLPRSGRVPASGARAQGHDHYVFDPTHPRTGSLLKGHRSARDACRGAG
jgi:hypothetical protein